MRFECELWASSVKEFNPSFDDTAHAAFQSCVLWWCPNKLLFTACILEVKKKKQLWPSSSWGETIANFKFWCFFFQILMFWFIINTIDIAMSGRHKSIKNGPGHGPTHHILVLYKETKKRQYNVNFLSCCLQAENRILVFTLVTGMRYYFRNGEIRGATDYVAADYRSSGTKRHIRPQTYHRILSLINSNSY